MEKTLNIKLGQNKTENKVSKDTEAITGTRENGRETIISILKDEEDIE